MTDFLIWYFNLTALQAVEFMFKALLLMILFSLPVIAAYAVFRRFVHAQNHSDSLKTHSEFAETES
ncbi:hypothetical protein [Alysiella crassa]|uniref:Uncharacterized protein n=1 Tax=Alysiella crassa TaxID=153491 RepID=A0A376BTL0_9NEIS|nr:hypothetical protein [Alysiella crassa]UOP05897.1 hypothetical protein LVJ80_08380 [Alysiella crassa]SSY80322.1 Uncharacterised protein [Alysiella crassa]